MGRPSSTSSTIHPILPAILLLAVLVLQESSSLADGAAAPPSVPSLVEKTCTAAHVDDKDDCINTLKSAPGSKNATDALDLVVIAANLTRGNVSETISAIKELMYNLRSCLKYYREMNYNLRMSIKAIKAGGDLSVIYEAMSKITSMPDDCDIILFESQYAKNPLQNENIRAKSLATLFSKLFDARSPSAPPVKFAPVDIGAGPMPDFGVDDVDDADDSFSDYDGFLGPSPMPPVSAVKGRKGNPGR